MMDIIKHPVVKIFLIFFATFCLYSFTTNINDQHGFITVPHWVIMIPTSLFSIAVASVLGKLDGNDKKISHHWLRFLTRGAILSIFPLAIYGFTLQAVYLLFLEAAVFWPTFNISYSVANEYDNILYIGTEANFDKALRFLKLHNGPGGIILVYLAFIVLGIYLNL